MNQFQWPLNVDNFNLFERLKIAWFILGKNKLTQGEKVQELEKVFSSFTDSKAVFVSSGSTANSLLASYIADTSKGEKDTVVLPAVTWQTSCSPWIREGFSPKFIDINLSDLSMDLDLLEDYLKSNSKRVAVVFVTSLLGFVPDINRLKQIEKTYDVRIMMDNCENTLGLYEGKSISSHFTSTTSTYFGHQLQSVEGGFIFTQSEDEYRYFLMGRNHGMTRSLSAYGLNDIQERNFDVHEKFDFCMLANNYRNTEINAMYGLIDAKKALGYAVKRRDLYYRYWMCLDSSWYTPPIIDNENKCHVPFALPIISIQDRDMEKIEKNLNSEGIETRPLISGNLLRQTAYKKYAKAKDFPIAEHIHKNAIYVGLHDKLEAKDIFKLVGILNENR